MINKIQLEEELRRNKEMLAVLEREADHGLKGHLVRQKNKSGTVRLYHARKEGKKTVYIRITEKNAGIVHTLRANRAYEKHAAELRTNIALLEQLLEGFRWVDFSDWFGVLPTSTGLLEDYPGNGALDWETLKRSAGSYRLEGLLYEADEQKFRSKGEAMHAMCFANAGIEYIYEPEIRIGNIVLHPDFVVRNKRTGRIYFWEFFGMMDVAEYQEAFSRKLPALMKLGIVPGYNLICTCVFKGVCTLSVSDIQAKIQAYLL